MEKKKSFIMKLGKPTLRLWGVIMLVTMLTGLDSGSAVASDINAVAFSYALLVTALPATVLFVIFKKLLKYKQFTFKSLFKTKSILTAEKPSKKYKPAFS